MFGKINDQKSKKFLPLQKNLNWKSKQEYRKKTLSKCRIKKLKEPPKSYVDLRQNSTFLLPASRRRLHDLKRLSLQKKYQRSLLALLGVVIGVTGFFFEQKKGSDELVGNLASKSQRVRPKSSESRGSHQIVAQQARSTSSDLKFTINDSDSIVFSEEEKNVRNYTDRTGDVLLQIAVNMGSSLIQLRQLNQLMSDKVPVGKEIQMGLTETSEMPQEMSEKSIYIVKTGDTLFSIAQKMNITVEELRILNALNSSEVFPGQQLTYAVHESTVSITQASNTIYQVKEGDTLYRIATTNGISVEFLQSLNDLSNFTIQVGQKIKLH